MRQPKKENPIPAKVPASLGLEDLLGYAYRGNVQLGMNAAEELIISYEDEELPAWFREALSRNKDILVRIVKARTLFKLIDDYVTKLRFENPTKGTRPQALAWLARKLREFEGLCDLPDGYYDPSEPWADSALSTLHFEYGELTAEGNPYPIPRDDPRPRFPNGKLEQTSA